MENKKVEIRKLMVAGGASFLGICALPDMIGYGEQIHLTNSIYLVFVWIGLSILLWKGMDRVVWKRNRENLIAGIFSLLFSMCMAIGSRLDNTEYITLNDWKGVLSIFCFTIPITMTVREVWTFMESDSKNFDWEEDGYTRKQFILVMILLIVSWLPVLLASYPGFFVYDAQEEVNEVLTRNFSTHHPLVHVLLLGGIVAAVHKITDSYNLGIVCYMIVQMIVVAYCFAYTLAFLKKHHVCKEYRIIAFLFLAFFPVIPMYVLCSSKDTLFAAALLLFILYLYELLTDTENFFTSWKMSFGLFFSAFFMLCFRHNGVYAYLVLLFFFIWNILKKKRKYGKKTISLMVIPVIAWWGVTTLLALLLQADTSEKQEILTVPIMQITRVHETDGSFFSEDEKEELYDYLPREAMALYSAKLSDNVKVHFNSVKYSEEPLGFWKLWFKAGISHIGTYLNAWMYTSYGFWYPDTVIDVYRGIQRYTFIYQDSSYFGYETEPPGERESKLPWLDEFYRKMSLEIAQQKIPIISMLFSPGFMFWSFAFGFAFFWKQKEYSRMHTFSIVFFLWLTVLLGPTYMVRYVLIFWFLFPMFIAMLFEKYTGFA